jgi:hypothetical protein
MDLSADFESDWFAEHPLEGRGVSCRRPELQFGISRGAQLQQSVFSPIVQLDVRDGLGMAAIEAFGQPQDRRQRLHHSPPRLGQLGESGMPALGRCPPVVAGDQREDLDLLGVEAAQIAVAYQVVRVFVMTLIADVHADVMEQRRVLEPLAFGVGQGVYAAGLIEQGYGQARDLVRVVRPIVAPFAELDDAATADVGIAFGLHDLLAMAFDVVEDQTLSQRQIAERDLLRGEPADDGVEQQCAGDGDIGAARFQAGHTQAALKIEVDELLAGAVDLFGGHPLVAQRRSHGTAMLRDGDGAKTQDRSRGADQAIESSGDDLVQVDAQAGFHMLDQLPLVAWHERVAFDEAFG